MAGNRKQEVLIYSWQSGELLQGNAVGAEIGRTHRWILDIGMSVRFHVGKSKCENSGRRREHHVWFTTWCCGKLKENLHQIDLYQLSLDIYQGPWGPPQSHKRNPIRDPICLNTQVSFQLTLLNICWGSFLRERYIWGINRNHDGSKTCPSLYLIFWLVGGHRGWHESR